MKQIIPLLLAACLLTLTVHAQVMTESETQMKWMKVGSPDDVLRFPNNEMVMPVRIDKKTYGVVRINDKAGEKWKYDLKGRDKKDAMIGIAKFNGNILVLISNDASNNYAYPIISRIEGILIDAATGSVIQEKVLFTLKGDAYVIAKLLRNKDGEFQHLMVRHTRWDGEEGFNTRKIEAEIKQSKKIELYAIAKDLTATVAHEYGINQDVYYYNSVVTPDGGLMVLWMNKGAEVVLEQFKGDGVESRVVLPLDWDKKTEIYTALKVNDDKPSQVLCGILYKKDDNMITTMLVDMENKTTKSFDEKINKEYRKQLEDQAQAFNSKRVIIEPMFFNEVYISELDFYQDKVIVIKEMGTPANNSYVNGDALITVLDKDMKLLKHFFVNKQYRDQGRGESVAANVAGDKLRFVANDNYGMGTYAFLYGEIDLKQLQWLKLTRIKEENRESFATPLRAWHTIWLPNSMLLNQGGDPSMLGKKIKGVLNPATYE